MNGCKACLIKMSHNRAIPMARIASDISKGKAECNVEYIVSPRGNPLLGVSVPSQIINAVANIPAIDNP